MCREVIRPLVIRAVECCPATKEAKRRLKVMRRKMLRTTGLMRPGRVRNIDVKKKFGAVLVNCKIRESRLRWNGHAIRAVRKIRLKFKIPGKQSRGRPKQRWLDTYTLTS